MPRQTFPGSSALAGADYQPETQTLVVTFRGGRGYTYKDVPADVYEQLCSADSPGSFWWQNIKDQYS